MDIIVITVILTAVAIGAHIGYERFSRGGRLRRAIQRARRVSIADAADGELVKLVGRLRFADVEPLSAPVTNRRCAYYEIEVEEGRYDDGSRRWVTVLRHSEQIERFIIEDETGQALIEPAGSSRVLLTVDQHTRTFSPKTLSNREPQSRYRSRTSPCCSEGKDGPSSAGSRTSWSMRMGRRRWSSGRRAEPPAR